MLHDHMSATPVRTPGIRTPLRRILAFALVALGLGLPLVRGLHEASPAHRMHAPVVRASCPDGCTEPGHHHEGHDGCALCSSHAPLALRVSLTRLQAPRAGVFVAPPCSGTRAAAATRSACVPRGPPALLVA
jgi:hypothetical protein